MRTSLRRRTGWAALGIVALSITTGCAAASSPAASAPAGSTTDAATPVDAAAPRIVVAFEGGLAVLDAATLEVVAELPADEFTRLNPLGDGRHVLASTSAGFEVLDAGTWTDAEGRSFTAEPRHTGLVFAADAPGHVVRHAGRTVLYDDGTSDTTVFDTDALLTANDRLPEVQTIPGVDAHHGVSVILEDGTLVTTVGDAEGRSGIELRDADGASLASSDECPGIHGEGTAADEAVVFGCEDGALLVHDGEIVKLAAPDQPYGRMGNAYVSETSPLVVGDYKTDPDAEGYLLSEVALIDTEARTLEVIELPDGVEYTFRDIARGPGDLAYVLATDGSIHVLDPAGGDITDSFPVVEAWEGPAEWQDPHPAIVVNGDTAYVTEPSADAIHAVDLNTGRVLSSATLDATPNELAMATG
jgi:hypothetical protein